VLPNLAPHSGFLSPHFCLAFVLCLIGALLSAASFAVPSPRDTHSVKDTIQAEATPASVTITEFSDFQCRYCQRRQLWLSNCGKIYGDKLNNRSGLASTAFTP
jgi:hypothetical protein